MLFISSILMTIGAILGTLAFLGLCFLLRGLYCTGVLKAWQEQMKRDARPDDHDTMGGGA